MSKTEELLDTIECAKIKIPMYAPFGKYEKMREDFDEIAAIVREHGEVSPCDVCAFNPPSSGDGKPCTMCPAIRKEATDATD